MIVAIQLRKHTETYRSSRWSQVHATALSPIYDIDEPTDL